MKKELLAIEFRYHTNPLNDIDSGYRSKTITIGVFDTLEEAIKEGNDAISILSKKFQVRADDKFMLKHLFGTPKKLVTNTCYPTNRIEYFAKITSLHFDSLEETINKVFSESKF